MTPRRWDVGGTARRATRRAGGAPGLAALVVSSLVVLSLMAVSGCGVSRQAAPPDPEFTTGTRIAPAELPPPGSTRGEGAEIGPDDVEPGIGDPAGSLADSMFDDSMFDVADLVVVDDAGNALPNGGGWARFDEVLGARLVPANVSASVAVMVDGQVVHAAAFGNRVAGTDDPVDTGDRFRVASISKTITAIVTMQLVVDGVLTLDEPVGDLLADHLGLATIDADARSITVRELLSHTAGFPKHEATFFHNGSTSCVDAASQGLSRSVSSGGSFRYSNMSYCVLGVLIEAVTGKTYDRVVTERLLIPLGISGMRMASTYDLGPDEVSHHPTPNRNFMETLAAAGSWNATPTDLVLILNSIDPETPGWKALPDDVARSMRTRLPGQAIAGYGLGLINYADSFGHTGTLQNTHAMVVRQPDGVTWAIAVSGEYPSDSDSLFGIMRSALAQAFPV